jgi:cardiolipin synthase (CMP-forming)
MKIDVPAVKPEGFVAPLCGARAERGHLNRCRKISSPGRGAAGGFRGVILLAIRSGSLCCASVDLRLPLNLPNLITLGRILLVPVVVWAIGSGQWQIAFLVFLIAGVSDAVDGFLAKRLDMTSELGAHLDPLADKALIVSIYVALGITEAIPRWLVILVVSRDILIVGGVMLAWFVGKPMRVKPLLVSKLNTVAQLILASLVLGSLAFDLRLEAAGYAAMAAVAALTLASVGFYVREWVFHMNAMTSD